MIRSGSGHRISAGRRAPIGSSPVAAVIDRIRLVPSEALKFLTIAIAVVSLPFLGLVIGADSALVGDVPAYHLPITAWVWDSILAGDSPFWGNWVFAGQNVAGIGQAGIFYPFNAVFGLVDPVVGLRWWILFHVVMAATGAYFWAWRSWRSGPAAAVAAIAYGLNGFLILHFVHMNFIACSAWIPWVFFGSDLVSERWSLKRGSVVVVPLAFITVCGGPQMIWITVAGLAIYSLVRLARRGAGLWPLIRVGSGVGLGVCLGAVQLLPFYLFSKASERPSLTFEAAMAQASQPKDLLNSFLPHIWGGGTGFPGLWAPWTGGVKAGDQNFYHEVSNHVGIVVLALAMVGIIAFRRDRRVISLTIVAIWAMVMAIGNSTPFGRLVFELVPGASLFRAWSRNIVMFNLAAAWLAGAGMKALVAEPSRWAMKLVLITAAVAAAILFLPAISDFGGAMVVPGAQLMALGFPAAILVAFAWSVMVMCRWRRIGIGLVLGLCSVNMVVFAFAAPWRQSDWLGARVGIDLSGAGPRAVNPDDAPGGVDRWVAEGRLVPVLLGTGTSVVDGTQMINGYDPLMQEVFGDITGALWYGPIAGDRLWSPGWIADVLRITTLIARPGFQPSGAGWTDVSSLDDSQSRIWQRNPRLPEAYVASRTEVATIAEITGRLLTEASDFRDTVFLESSGVNSTLFSGDSAPGSAAAVVEGSIGEHGSGRFVVESDGPGLLVVSTGWLDGWSATVNGKHAPVVRANGLTLAVPIGAGSSEVKLKFTPPGLHLGLAVSVLALVILLFSSRLIVATGMLVGRRTSKRRVSSP
ncbi:Uncharacterised protein family YfhO [Acidimicrobiia bacterium]